MVYMSWGQDEIFNKSRDLGVGEDMKKPEEYSLLVDYISELKENEALSLVKKLLAEGHDSLIIFEGCHEGVRRVGELYKEGRYFVSGLIMAGEIMRQVIDLIQPTLKSNTENSGPLGNLVMGTVTGDIHDIGKDIAIMLLNVEGFNVIDLGVDVPPEKFVDAIKKHKPIIVGLSCLITNAFKGMKETIKAIEDAGLRTGISIIIGGGIIDDDVCKYVGADKWTNDAIKGADWCKQVAQN